MVRETSVAAYERLVSSGKQDSYKARILHAMIGVYPKTRTRLELCSDLDITVNTMTGLVTPMVKDGILCELGKRPCLVTGNIVFEVQAVIEDQLDLFGGAS